MLVLLFWVVLIGMGYYVYSYNKWVFYGLLMGWALIWSLTFKKWKQKLLFLIPLLLLFILLGLLLFPSVQTYVTQKVAADLSKKLNAKVSVKRLKVHFFNKVSIEEVLVEDLKKDTILYAGSIKGSVNDWFFFKDKISIENVVLDDAVIKLHRSDSIWNYQFIADYFSSPKKTKKDNGAALDIDLKELHFNKIRFSQIDEWIGQDMTVTLAQLDVKTDAINVKNKKIYIKEIYVDKPFFAQNDYDGNRPEDNTPKPAKVAVLSDYKWNTDSWEIKLDKLDLKNGVFKNDKQTEAAPYNDRFDGQHLFFSNINGTLKNLLFLHDTITVNGILSATEKSGLEVKKLSSNIKFTPEIMEFDSLDLITNKSRLRDYYAMRYESFNRDFSRFLHNVMLEGHFKESTIHSDDLAIFAPALKSWKRLFYIEGNAKGILDNFSAKDMKIKTGNTYLEGNIALRGLPDINTTFIDFQSRDLRTNYADMVSIVPKLKEIKNPAIDKLGAVSFTGNFTGFIKDFVAFGNFTTALGNITADVNMKTPDGKPAKYSGNISSTGFNIGSFINTKELGNVALDVNIDGTGFSLKELKEKVKGNVSSIKYGNYTYKNIKVDGDIADKLFKGHFSIDDTNLKISSLDGAISFLEKTPGFKLQANVQKADLKSLGLAKDNFLFKGDLDLDFTGSNIDNFLGNAKVMNAKLLQGDNQLSFDFLNINSEIIAGQKSLTVNTNEVDANVTGNFKIMELPDAVKLMLSKYYPAYIKAPKYNVKSTQNFSFNVKTNNADAYVKLLDKRLGGFNNATISGRFNLQDYNLNLNATIPQFSYDGKIFNNLTLVGNGNRDSLINDIAVEDITVNDSLHLPNSTLRIAASNDVSLIKLNTSASKIFGNAELNASVETMSDGVKIHFSPSSFIVNNKKWQLDKDGELILTKSIIGANEVKFFSGERSITLKTELSQVNNDTHLIANLKNVDIGDFAFVLPKKPVIRGIVTGELVVSNVLKKPNFHFEGRSDSTSLDGIALGTENIVSDFNTSSGIITYNLDSDEKDYKYVIKGSYNTKDTLGNALQTTIKADRLKLNILKPYLKTIFTDVDGIAKGDIELVQKNNALSIIGDPMISNGSLKVGYTQVRYNFDNQQIHFGKDVIDVGTLQITDTLGNKGTVSGKIYHTFFDNFSFENLRFSTQKMLLLNTTKKDNQQFYGKVIGRATMSLDGDIANMKMNIDGEPSYTESSHVYLPTGDSKESNLIDYIDFIQFGSVMENEASSKGAANLDINLHLIANDSCKIDVILDESTGDVIKGEGKGDLTINVGTNKPLTMFGTYELTKGEYTFDFQTLLRKPFTLTKGGTISWSGDPLLANIDIKAEYTVKNVDLSSFSSLDNSRKQEDIRLSSHLIGSLKKPIINFEFLLPENSQYKKDFYLLKRLADFKTDENEMNKQVASLLLLNQFISNTQGLGSVSSLASGAIGGTLGGIVSSWLTSILNKALEKATKGVVSFVVDVNPSLNAQQANQLQANIRSSLQFKLNKNLRLLVGGNLEYNNPLLQVYSKGVVTPDLSLEWLINKDGTIRAVLFNRTTIDATSGQRNRTALQLGYRRDVDRFWDIFRSKKKIAELDSVSNAKGKVVSK
jgi:hypothetical protein